MRIRVWSKDSFAFSKLVNYSSSQTFPTEYYTIAVAAVIPIAVGAVFTLRKRKQESRKVP